MDPMTHLPEMVDAISKHPLTIVLVNVIATRWLDYMKEKSKGRREDK